jgi:phage-related protein
LVRSLGEGLLGGGSFRFAESNRTARLLLCFREAVVVVLHGFIKKGQKTPKADWNWRGAG